MSTDHWSIGVLVVLDGDDAAVAAVAADPDVCGNAQPRLGPLAGRETGAIAGLPAEEFPHMAAAARTAAGGEPKREFFGGLDLLLRGLDG